MSPYAQNTLTFTSPRTQQKGWRRTDSAGSFRRNQNSVSFMGSTKLGPVAHTVLVVVMLAILGLIYLTQVTKTSVYGYEINNLQTKRDSLLSQKQDLEVQNARLEALAHAQDSNVAKAMTSPASVDYAQN